MQWSPKRFLVEDLPTGQAILRDLSERWPSQEDQQTSELRTYFDSFDWRVFRSGGILWVNQVQDVVTLYWDPGDRSLALRMRLDHPLGFVRQLPDGCIRDHLESLIEMRRLLALVDVESSLRSIRILDSQEKTVVRVVLEQAKATARADPETVELPVTLGVLPVRGYAKQLDRLLDVLANDFALSPVEPGSESTAIFEEVGLHPGDYGSKIEFKLQPTDRTDSALESVFQKLLTTIRINENGLRLDIDSEFLHDFRVAVRRTRSGLSQFKGVFPSTIMDRFKKDFSWLGQITGPTRDLDVYRLKYPEYRACLPAPIRADLDPLLDLLDRHFQVEHRDLVQLLDSDRYRNLLADWQDFLTRPSTDSSIEPNSSLPILEVASHRIWRSYKRVLKKGLSIGSDTPANALHRLRIESKKLRYLLEIFRSLYDPKIASLIKELKKLQDNLGDFNDLEIQQQALSRLARSMLLEGASQAETVMAMGRLIEQLEERQSLERATFHTHFDRFARKRNRKLFRELFDRRENALK